MPITFKVEKFPSGSYRGWFRLTIIDGASSKFIFSPEEFKDLKKQMEKPVDYERG